jgi:signal transduction histidine kinase
MSDSLRVLLVEDNPGDAELLVEMLPSGESTLYDVECVARLSVALELVAAEQFDLVLLDLGLPDSDGLATLHIMREQAAKLPIVVLTGNNDEQTGLDAIKEGAQDYLVKGQTDKGLLLRSINYAVERKRSANALKELNDTLEERIAERTAQITSVNETLLIEIYDRKRAEEETQQAKELAETATKAKSQFLANMSHELRTPMAGVLGMLDIALAGNLEAKQREFIETAQRSASSLVRILNDILDLTKIEMGNFSIVAKPFPIRKLLENTFNILMPAAKSKGLDFGFKVADDLAQTFVGDQTRLNQVLTNLAGNAVKFTEKGRVEIRVAAGGSVPGGRREVTFTVTDTGIGIPDDKKDLLFRVFSQVDESHSRIYGGTGLGLAISKEIVERMEGTITFTSDEGRGSTFSFTIPLGEAELERDAGLAPEKTAATGAAPRADEIRKPRLLVAEDDQTIRQVLGVMLQRSNYEIDIAEDGQKVVEMWEDGEYDLILMDIQMPRMNGFEATGAIRENERTRGGHIPIVAMTAHALKEDEERCLDAGMDAYVSKPIDFKVCLLVIGEALKKQPSH